VTAGLCRETLFNGYKCLCQMSQMSKRRSWEEKRNVWWREEKTEAEGRRRGARRSGAAQAKPRASARLSLRRISAAPATTWPSASFPPAAESCRLKAAGFISEESGQRRLFHYLEKWLNEILYTYDSIERNKSSDSISMSSSFNAEKYVGCLTQRKWGNINDWNLFC